MRRLLAFALFLLTLPTQSLADDQSRFSFVDATEFENVDCKNIRSQLDEAICTADLAAQNKALQSLSRKLSASLFDLKSADKTFNLEEAFVQEQVSWKAYRNALCNLEALPYPYWEAGFTVCVSRENKTRLEFLEEHIHRGIEMGDEK